MRQLLLFFLCCAVSASLQAQVSAKQLAALDQYIEKARQQWESPGLGVAIVKDGKVVHAKGYGLRETGTDKKADTQTLFAICSTTKAMVAAGMGILVDEGKVGWDDRVIDRLPEFQVADPYLTREIRIRDLFTHNAGMGNTDLLWVQGMPSDEIFRRLRYAEPLYPLRGGFSYHNNMYLVAGKVMERVSGMAWEAFMIEKIFKPLGMNRTFPMKKYVEKEENKSTPHHYVNGKIEPIWDMSVDNAAPAGAIWSCLDDMAKWMQFMLGDGQPLLKEKTFAELLRPHAILTGPEQYPALDLKKPKVTTYSLGWFQYHHDGRFVNFHTGSLPGTIAMIGIIPDEGLGVYIWGNLDHAEVRHALMYKVFDVFGPDGDSGRDYSAEALELYTKLRDGQRANMERQEQDRVQNTKPSLDLTAYAGVYTHQMMGELLVEAKESKLQLQLGNIPMEAVHWHYDTFGAVMTDRPWQEGPMPVQFRLDGRGEAMEVEVMGFTFRRE